MYTVADIAIWPWIYALHEFYDEAIEVWNKVQYTLISILLSAIIPDVVVLLQSEFHGLVEVPFVKEWYQRCIGRNASKKSLEVCSFVFPDA